MNFGLDIIIPAYKNLEGLEKTLKSFYSQEIFYWSQKLNFPINILVIDDCSGLDYNQFYNKYPKIKFQMNDKNQGPGIVRQNGIDNTYYPYIIFIDSGDYLLSKYAIIEIMLTIKQYPNLFMYSWCHIDEKTYFYIETKSPLLRGTVYNRQFLKKYKITFCPQSSYANEDVGFNRACQLIIANLTEYNDENMIQFFKIPIYMYTYDENSLSRKNNRQFLYKKQLPSLINNTYHVIKIGEENNVRKQLLWEEVSYILVRLYYDFRVIVIKDKENAQQAWDLLKKYYKELYCKYKMEDTTIQKAAIGHNMRNLIKLGITNINFNKFLKELETEKNIPQYYF